MSDEFKWPWEVVSDLQRQIEEAQSRLETELLAQECHEELEDIRRELRRIKRRILILKKRLDQLEKSVR